MRAVGFYSNHPADHCEALVDLTLPDPTPGPRDLLVEVRAAGVNPIDCKLRQRIEPADGASVVLGFDACGKVLAVGKDVTLFQPGDEVFYAGSMQRSGANAQLHCVDERLVGHKPKSLDDAEAAALPLTAITAWEMLFEKFRVGVNNSGGTLLVIGGAGGVGSILIQLARKLTNLTIVATASRPESIQWCVEMGAHHVIDHRQPMQTQIEAIGLKTVDYVACLTASDQHIDAVVGMLSVFGQLCVIDDLTRINMADAKRKCLTVHWEFMFARSNHQTADMGKQGELLNQVARLIDRGVLRTTMHDVLEGLSAEQLKLAHIRQEGGSSIGKIVVKY